MPRGRTPIRAASILSGPGVAQRDSFGVDTPFEHVFELHR